MPTRQEIASRASSAAAAAARRRRFNNAAIEMAENPDDLLFTTADCLAAVLQRKGWRIDASGVVRPS